MGMTKAQARKAAEAELAARGIEKPDMAATTTGGKKGRKAKEEKPDGLTPERISELNAAIVARLNAPKAAFIRKEGKGEAAKIFLQCVCGQVAGYSLPKMAGNGFIACSNCKRHIEYGTYKML